MLKSCQRFTLHQCRPAIARPPYSISRLCAKTTVAVPDPQAPEIEPAPTIVQLELHSAFRLVSANDLPAIIGSLYQTLSSLGKLGSTGRLGIYEISLVLVGFQIRRMAACFGSLAIGRLPCQLDR